MRVSGRGLAATGAGLAVAVVAMVAVPDLAAGEREERPDPAGWRSEAGAAEAPARRAEMPAAHQASPPPTDHVIVRFRPGTSPADEQRALRRAGAAGPPEAVLGPHTWRLRVGPGHVEDALDRLRASAQVQVAEPDPWVVALNHAVHPDDPEFGEQWGVRNVRLPQAWQVEQGEPSVVIAVVDTGVDLDHPELAANLVTGHNVLNSEASPDDDHAHSHGTSVAGVAAAAMGNGVGGAGACPGCSVMPVKALNAEGLGLASDVAAGIVWAVDNGADIVNLSLGSSSSAFALADAVAHAAGNGVIVVAAAGNAGTEEPVYPAATDGVLAVAATAIEGDLYSFSNRGSWVEASAPGCNRAPVIGGGSAWFCGTSSAAPLSAGVLAVAWSWSPTTPAADLLDALAGTARATEGIGGGQADAERLLTALGAAVPDGRET